MEKYDIINVVGEGSYGLVMRCRHRDSGQYVAIKKFLETEDEPNVKKMATREIRMLKKLHHENLVNMLEVFRKKRRYFLVFEYLEHTVLEELEARAGGLGFVRARKYIYQILRALNFIHSNNVIHRDIKPENILVSRLGIIKLCDFGFARLFSDSEKLTDYVATRWYRSPELLVGDPRYGKEVDIWAIGCLYAEMMTGEPLFPGESDIDQLYQIIRVLGPPSQRHQDLITQSPSFSGIKQVQETNFNEMFPDWNRDSLNFLNDCLKMDGNLRPSTDSLLNHELFKRDDFAQNFLPKLKAKIKLEIQSNPLSKRMISTLSGGNKSSEDKSRSKQNQTGLDVKNSLASISKERTSTDISMMILNGQHQHNLNFGNDDHVAPFRHYLNNSQTSVKPQIKQISINNLVFQDRDETATTTSRIYSAKHQNTSIFERSQSNQPSLSPISFQSLQPEVKKQDIPIQGKRLSPVQKMSFFNTGGNQHMNKKKCSNVIGLQKIASQPSNTNRNRIFASNSESSLRSHLPVKITRNNNIDTNIFPINLNSSKDTTTIPQILSSTHLWPNGNHKNKINSIQKFNTNSNTARESNDFLLPHFNVGGGGGEQLTSTSPYKGNKKKLSPMSIFREQTILPTEITMLL